MYFVDFIKSLIKRGNISIVIYLVINIMIIVLLVGGIIGDLFYYNYYGGQIAVISAVSGLIIYAISLAIALSPIGEWILRFQLGCNKITRANQINYLEPLFEEVYSKAKEMDPSLSNDIHLFINSEESVNAFATGRKTICVNSGLLTLPQDQIKATLAHEFGHISNKDTDLILVIAVGNFVITSIVLIIRVVVGFFTGLIGGMFGDRRGIIAGLCVGAIAGVMWIWTKIGTLLVMKSSRDSEYKADEFSWKLGYGDSLCALIDQFSDSEEKGLFAALSKSHPDKDDRIANIQQLGSCYRASSPDRSFESDIKEGRGDFARSCSESQSGNQVSGMIITIVCGYCGANLKDSANFCSKCGNPVSETAIKKMFCAACGSEIRRPNSKYCTKCGARLFLQ